ncbi:DISP3 protein, partial [Atractosteus spatula]|nr:DISP3 protein [Atractosteus spatula]
MAGSWHQSELNSGALREPVVASSSLHVWAAVWGPPGGPPGAREFLLTLCYTATGDKGTPDLTDCSYLESRDTPDEISRRTQQSSANRPATSCPAVPGEPVRRSGAPLEQSAAEQPAAQTRARARPSPRQERRCAGAETRGPGSEERGARGGRRLTDRLAELESPGPRCRAAPAHLSAPSCTGLAMDSEDDPLMLQSDWPEEEEDEEDEGVEEEEGGSPGTVPARAAGSSSWVWGAVGWVYTCPWACCLVLALGVLLPCALSAFMFLRCPPLDIDLSYSAFEVRGHASSERFDALTLALKAQLGSWGRSRRDVDGYASQALRDLLLQHLQRQRGGAAEGGASAGREVLSGRRDAPAGSGQRVTGFSGELDPEPDPARVKQREAPARRGRLWPPIAPRETDRARRRREMGVPREAYLHEEFVIPSYTQSHAHWRMELVFVAQGEGDPNIFTPERLRTIHAVERRVMEHPQFRQFCWKPPEVLRDPPLGPFSYCSPPSSLLSYLFPTARGGRIYYDGMGPDLADIRGALRLAITHPEFYWYVDESLTAETLRSSLLRSELHFGAPLPSFLSLQDRPDEQRRRFRQFVITYADMLAQQSTSQVKVLYGGTDLFDYEVRRTFHRDMLLALASGACIAALVYILTSFSVFLSFFGLASIGLSCLVALFLYHVGFGVQYLGILNGVAAFVIIGIGVDDVFVFINTFQQAGHLREPGQRMVHTVQTAGRATFLTSFTTAAAYAANTFSQIPAVHDFGLFMALIVSCCWLWVLLMLPAALCLWSRWLSPRETACLRRLHKQLKFNFCQSQHETRLPGPGNATLSYLDDDIPLLSVEAEPGPWEPDTDAPLLTLAAETDAPSSGPTGMGLVSSRLQEVLRSWVAQPAVEWRHVIVGLYVVVLLVSAGFCSLLRPASRAPLLFSPDTNIQALLDLRSNLSLFLEKPHSLPRSARPCAGNSGRHSQSQCQATAGSQTFKPGPPGTTDVATGLLLTVYVSKLQAGAGPPLYRFSLNASVPLPWKPLTPGNGEVPSFQAFGGPHRNFTTRLTVCVAAAGQPRPAGMITSRSCDPSRGWRSEFSFFVASAEQQHSRKLYFAQLRRSPFHSRVCAAPPGCVLSSGPDGPTKGSFYTPVGRDQQGAVSSATSGFNPCENGACGKPAARPLVDTGAMVFVVFGILGVNRTRHTDNHVIGDMGSVVYDPTFDLFREIGHLCRLCKTIGSNSHLVKPGGAQCLPSGSGLSSLLPLLHPECQSLPQPSLLPGQLSHGALGLQDGAVRWVSMAFESTTYKGKSSFQTLSDFLQWESFLQEQLSALPQSSALRRGFQTCEHWKQIFMEILGKLSSLCVQSALYSLLLSLAICIAAVSVFTAHLRLLLPVLLTILGVVCLVVAAMYWAGWEMGAVEAISLSILVGSSVDYCLHLVEGFLLAGESVPPSPSQDPGALRRRRTLAAIDHVGVAIISSAVTTVIATVPLFFCVIAPFAKFGKIVALNTAVSVAFTLSVGAALLATMGPARFSRPPAAVLQAGLAVLGLGAAGVVLRWALGYLGVPAAWSS